MNNRLTASPNLACDINLSEEEDEDSLMEENIDSSGEKQVKKESHRKEETKEEVVDRKGNKKRTRISFEESTMTSHSLTTTGSSQDELAANVSVTTTEDGDDVSPFVDPQTSFQAPSTKKQKSSRKQSGSSAKVAAPRRNNLKQKDPPKKSNAGKNMNNQKPTNFALLY